MLRPELQFATLSRVTLRSCIQLLTLPMGSTSSLDPMTGLFESGVPRLVLPSASLYWGTGDLWCLLHTPQIGGILSQDLVIVPSEYGMLGLVMQLANLYMDTPGLWLLSHILLTAGTSFLDPMILPFESGVLRLVVQWASLWRGTLIWCALLLTLPMGCTS